MTHYFKLALKSGPDNIRQFQEKGTQAWRRGELVQMVGTGTTALVSTATASASTGFLGVAAKKGQNTTTPSEKAEIYVVTPDQVWELHVDDGKIPRTNYSLGDAYHVKLLASASYTMTRAAEATSTLVSMRGPVLTTTTATGGNSGLVLIGYADDATKTKKGQKVLVRFGPAACQVLAGRTPS